MIQFVLPAALLAAAGIIVPILLHLWRPPARTVRLGSLRFLETLPGRRLRDLRWRDRLLLLLRVALVLALAGLLAGPLWVDRRSGPQRWALLAPHAVLDGNAQQAWRELLAQGYQPRRLAPGFPRADASIRSGPEGVFDVWSMLREADARVPADSKLVVLAPTRVATLRGARPALVHSEVRWVAATADDETASAAWIGPLAVIPSGRGARVTIGTSDATSTRFSTVEVPASAGASSISDPVTHAELITRQTAGNFAVRLANAKPEQWVPVFIHRPIRVAIVHGPQRAEDARYVAAAVQAVGEVSDRPITVEIREETASTVLPEADWVFRLGASPLTPSMSRVLAEDRVNVVTDAAREAAEDLHSSWFVAPNDQIGVDEIRLWRRAESGTDAGAVIWSDGFGHPLLAFAREGRAERWRFFSRFHPESNDWVSRGAFPAWMRQLLLGVTDNADLRSHDRRLADIAQVQPARAAVGEAASILPPAAGWNSDLHAWLWALVALLLALERGLSLRTAAQRAADPAEATSKPAPQLAEVGR